MICECGISCCASEIWSKIAYVNECTWVYVWVSVYAHDGCVKSWGPWNQFSSNGWPILPHCMLVGQCTNFSPSALSWPMVLVQEELFKLDECLTNNRLFLMDFLPSLNPMIMTVTLCLNHSLATSISCLSAMLDPPSIVWNYSGGRLPWGENAPCIP